MAEKLTIEVPIKISGGIGEMAESMGGKTSENLEQTARSVKTTADLSKNLVKIAAGVGVVAAIWQGLEPILKPVLTMFRLLMTIIFLPLLPIMRQVAERIKDVAERVRRGQEEAGGAGAGAFLGGLGAFFDAAGWELAGAAVALAFLATIGAGTALAAALTVALGINWIMSALSEGDLADALKGSLAAGVAIAIAASIFGATGMTAVTIGAIAVGITLSFILFGMALKEGEWQRALGLMLGSSAIAGIVIAAMINPAAGVLVAAAVLVVELEIKFKILETIKNKLKEIMGSLFGQTPGMESLQQPMEFEDYFGLQRANESVETLGSTVEETIPLVNQSMSSLADTIGNQTESNQYLTGSLVQAESQWSQMKVTAIEAITSIISELNRIPREIVTVHRIITRRG